MNKLNEINSQITSLKKEALDMMEALEEYYPIGSYIRKNSIGETFNIHHNGVKNINPYKKIKSVSFNPKTKIVLINGHDTFPLDGLPISISQEEAYKLKDMWNAIQIEPIRESKNKEFEHFRQDTGKAKEPLKENQARKLLYKRRLQNPDSNYEIYKCTVCGELHIGKIKNTEDTTELVLKFGGIKGGDFKTSPEALVLFMENNEIVDTQTIKDKECEVIDLFNGKIYLYWDGVYVTKEQAKEYIQKYPEKNI